MNENLIFIRKGSSSLKQLKEKIIKKKDNEKETEREKQHSHT